MESQRPMIDLGTLGGLHKNAHELWAYCARCDRWSKIDLAGLIAAGQGDRRLPLPVRCADCGTRGELQVRPPVPTRGQGGWIEPP